MEFKDAAQLVTFMLNYTLRNCEACSVDEDVVGSVREAIAVQPTDEFPDIYKDMTKKLAAFIVKDANKSRSYLLHDVLMTMNYRLKPAFEILYTRQ